MNEEESVPWTGINNSYAAWTSLAALRRRPLIRVLETSCFEYSDEDHTGSQRRAEMPGDNWRVIDAYDLAHVSAGYASCIHEGTAPRIGERGDPFC